MKGDIIAPGVVLADGARFRGSIDMVRKSAPAMSSLTRSVMPELARPVGGKAAVGD